jgi:hypothetical protein
MLQCFQHVRHLSKGGRVVFRLRKWYMDCVAADGTTAIAYWASLAWGIARLNCAAVLVRRAGTIAEHTTLRGGKEPRYNADGIAWRCGPLHFQGQWQTVDPPVCRTLLAASAGNIEWKCLVPRARARLLLTEGEKIDGLGYAEQLEMTIRPWHLPIRELRWGRFLSERTSAVWIEWRGVQPLILLFVNGSAVDEAVIGTDGISWRGGRLELKQDILLRDGKLGSTVLTNFPLARVLMPRFVLEMQENKRLCRGKLVDDGGQLETGWAIDEVVHFGRSTG